MGAYEDPKKQWPYSGLCAAFGKENNPKQVGRIDMDGVCPHSDDAASPFEITDVGIRVRNPEEDSVLLDDLRHRIDRLFSADLPRRKSLEDAWSLLKRLQGVNAKDVLALRETWTDADTDILKKLDGGRGGFAPEELTTEAFRQ